MTDKEKFSTAVIVVMVILTALVFIARLVSLGIAECIK